jgi:MFS family permease
MLRPFVLLYAVLVQGMSLPAAGLALSLGFVAGLVTLPFAGRWLDAGARQPVVATALIVRAVGLALMLLIPGSFGFGAAAVLLGIGSQLFPPAHAAVIASLATGRDRDAALAASRALRNAGMGVGALAATLALAGADVMRVLAVVTAVAYVISAITVMTTRLGTANAIPVVPVLDVGARDLHDKSMRVLYLGNLPYALCFDVLEIVLPAVLVTQLQVSPAWASTVFLGNTVLVIATQFASVRWLTRYRRRSVLGASGLVLSASYLGFFGATLVPGVEGALLICVMAVVYTAGEIMYTGSGTALVAVAAPPGRLGHHLARWQLSTGLGRALAPVLLMGLLVLDPALLWVPLAAVTALGALFIWRHGPHDEAMSTAQLDRSRTTAPTPVTCHLYAPCPLAVGECLAPLGGTGCARRRKQRVKVGAPNQTAQVSSNWLPSGWAASCARCGRL